MCGKSVMGGEFVQEAMRQLTNRMGMYRLNWFAHSSMHVYPPVTAKDVVYVPDSVPTPCALKVAVACMA